MRKEAVVPSRKTAGLRAEIEPGISGKLAQRVPFLTCIQEVLGSNVDLGTGYPAGVFFVFFLSPSRQMPACTSITPLLFPSKSIPIHRS
jgi:hypothetical protein